MDKIGITVGKFMPMHIGHEAMIEFTARQLDHLYIIVSSSSDLDYNINNKCGDITKRALIIASKYEGRNITVIPVSDDMGAPTEVDKHGTATSNSFWNYWLSIFKNYAPNVTHFVSSDRYGAEAAKRLGIKWLPVDPDRELFDISATKIRQDPLGNWNYISKEFRKFYVKKVVVVGPESTGKSTLVKDLGKFLNSLSVPEYGRIKSDAEVILTEDDFNDIITGQRIMNDIAVEQSNNGLIIVDTEEITTFLYSGIYLPNYMNSLPTPKMDTDILYVVLPPQLPWEDDGTRVMPLLKDRQEFYDKLREKINIMLIPHVVITETDRDKRVFKIAQTINEHFKFENNKYDIGKI